MDLIDRYLSAIRANLHRPDADDIILEIREELASQVDALAAEGARVGRTGDRRDAFVPAADEAIIVMLRRYGHPRIVAARYSAHPSLIGPELLPFYWYAVKIVGTVVVASILAGGLIAGVGFHDASIFLRSVGFAWNAAFIVAGVVTVMFATAERVATPQRSPLDRLGITRWDPRRLPEPSAHTVSSFTSIIDIVANGVALLLLLDFARFREGIFTLIVPHAQNWAYAPTAAWQPLYVTVLVSTAVITVAGFITLLRPPSMTVRAGVYAAAHAVVVIGAALTLRAGPLFTPTDPGLEQLCTWSIVAVMCTAAVIEAVYAVALLRRLPSTTLGARTGLPGQRP